MSLLNQVAIYETTRVYKAGLNAIYLAVDAGLKAIGARDIRWSTDQTIATAKTPFVATQLMPFKMGTFGERWSIEISQDGGVDYTVRTPPMMRVDKSQLTEQCHRLINEVAKQLPQGATQ